MGCGGSKPTKAVENVSTVAVEQTAANGAEVAKTLLDSAPAKVGEEVAVVEAEAKLGGKDEATGRVPLKVTVLSARGLRNADCVLAGKSDPYCICEILGRTDSKRQTNTVNDQLNPQWNHEFEEITSYCLGDWLTFTVKDSDPIKPDDFLGKVTLKSEQFFPNGFEDEISLTEAGDKVEAFLKVKVEVVHPKVRVTLVGATNLRNADWVGKSDPYSICGVADKADSKIQSVSVAENLNPKWNHEAEIVGYQAGDALTFTVKDKDPVKPDDVLGTVSLPYSSFCETGFEGELQLTGATAGLNSLLAVKVELGNKAEELAEVADETIKEEVAAEEQIVKEPPSSDVCTLVPVDVTVEETASAGKTCFC